MSNTAQIGIQLNFNGLLNTPIPASLSLGVPYATGVSGTIEVPDGTMAAHNIPIGFSGIGKAKLILLVNRTSQELGVRINGAMADEYQLPANGVVIPILAPLAATANKLTSLSLETTAMQVGDGGVDFLILGDA